jgi:catalase
MTDGADAAQFAALTAACDKEGTSFEVIAPKIGGVILSDRKKVPAKQKIDGGPSVLYDAVALLVSAKGADLLAKDAPTRDFIADAFAHCKFVGYTAPAAALLQAANVKPDGGFLALKDEKSAAQFIKLCRNLRFWDREAEVDADAE